MMKLGLIASLLILLLLPAAAGAAGKVEFVAGAVSAISAAGSERKLAKGDVLANGDVVRTGPDGLAQLRFDDGGRIALQSKSEFRIDEYAYPATAQSQERGFFSLLKGGMRTITGQVGRDNRDAYRVTTSVATIGIRGTEYRVIYIDDDAIALWTADGVIEVCNKAGCSQIVAGESAIVRRMDLPIERLGFNGFVPPAGTSEGSLLPGFAIGEGRNGNGYLSGVPKCHYVPPGPPYYVTTLVCN